MWRANSSVWLPAAECISLTACHRYVNSRCATYGMADLMRKGTPNYQFFTTQLYERNFTSASCTSGSTCNANTPDVHTNGYDTCECHTNSNFYVINPEVCIWSALVTQLSSLAAGYAYGAHIPGVNPQCASTRKSVNPITSGLWTILRRQCNSEGF